IPRLFNFATPLRIFPRTTPGFSLTLNNLGVEGINENETNQDKEDGGDNRSAKLPKLMSSVVIGKELEELIVAILESLNVEKG
ncbi:389_t:CDS:2, partial [Funneliformis mosseae]